MAEQATNKHSMTGKPPLVPREMHPDTLFNEATLRYGRGWEAPTYLPGDFILTHQRGWANNLIRFGQGLRYRGDDRKYANYNHAAIITTTEGALVEAVGVGVIRSNLGAYRKEDYALVRVSASDDDRQQAVDYANYCVGAPYGWFTLVSLAWTLLTGGKFSFGVLGSHICSGLVAGALERTGAIWDRPNDSIMPADLARYYDVREGA